MGIPEVIVESTPVHPIFNKDKVVRDKEMSKLVKEVIVDTKVTGNDRLRKMGVSVKGPRTGSKLSVAVAVVTDTGKDDKESCLKAIINELGVKRGNATIYYAKALAVIGAAQ